MVFKCGCRRNLGKCDACLSVLKRIRGILYFLSSRQRRRNAYDERIGFYRLRRYLQRAVLKYRHC